MAAPVSAAVVLSAPLPAVARQLLTAISLNDEIRNAASLVSILLALLTLFTNRRLNRLDDQRQTLGRWTWAACLDAALDSALLLLTLAVLTAISPLIVSAWPP